MLTRFAWIDDPAGATFNRKIYSHLNLHSDFDPSKSSVDAENAPYAFSSVRATDVCRYETANKKPGSIMEEPGLATLAWRENARRTS